MRDWAKLQQLAEFAYTASKHKVTEKILFEADLGYISQMPFDVFAATTGNSYHDPGSQTGGQQVVSFATTMADILAQLQDEIAIAQVNQAAEANKNPQPHNFQSGDRVMINTRNMPLSYGATTPRTDTHTHKSGARLSQALHQRHVRP
jgi:hypothetical protein